MDDATLIHLRAALATSPDNIPLLLVLVRAHLERQDPQAAFALVQHRAPSCFPSSGDRRLAARAALAAGDASAALAFLTGDTPDELTDRARALLAQDRSAEGLAAYRSAVAANPAVEDPA